MDSLINEHSECTSKSISEDPKSLMETYLSASLGVLNFINSPHAYLDTSGTSKHHVIY